MKAKDHYIQDSLECYCVFRMTQICEEFGKSLSNDSLEKLASYNEYCEKRKVDPSKDAKEYWEMYQTHIPDFIMGLFNKYPDCKFDFVDVEKVFRNDKKKGDFLIIIEGDGIKEEKSVSLKAYKGGFDRVQACSGTFNSFINNFIFTADGVGMFRTEDGTRFQGANRKKRNENLEKIGYSSAIPTFTELDGITDAIKEKYVTGEGAEFWQDVENDWKEDCGKFGNLAIDLTLKIIDDNFTQDQIKNRILRMSGFDGDEDLLFIDTKKMVNSITCDKFGILTKKLRDDETRINYYKNKKSIIFDFVDKEQNVLLNVEIPFTLNKNGAWFTDNPEGEFHKGEGKFLKYGQRRPKKSQQLSTSINTYVNIKSSGII